MLSCTHLGAQASVDIVQMYTYLMAELHPPKGSSGVADLSKTMLYVLSLNSTHSLLFLKLPLDSQQNYSKL